MEALCYNKGCGNTFILDGNMEDSCCYHPGSPVFHDAYKGWSCCNKKSTDFTTFLNLPGCKRGKHNPEKPPEVIKAKIEPMKKDEVIVVKPPVIEELPRVDFHSPLVKVDLQLSQSLKNNLNTKKETESSDTVISDGQLQIGELCKNRGCNESYSEECETSACTHHPGFPVFHEGMKFWSCCTKRTSDFNTFLSQPGCTIGTHLWEKPEVQKTNCRYDWHQTGPNMIVTIYAKNPNPELSNVFVNPIRLHISITFSGTNSFELDSELFGVIDVNKTVVTLYPTKVEIKLWKAQAISWKTLFIDNPKLKTTAPVDVLNESVDALSVNSVDLSDI